MGYEQATPFGWLVLEEASAETFIPGALIPLFAPKLAALKTASSRGAGNLKRSVESLRSMILYAHLANSRPPRAWVLADGDQAGIDAITALQDTFKTWPRDRFITLDQPSIEDYYASIF